MALGLAYDSDAGRALAASITSLMTGASYKRSAELAGVVGAYNVMLTGDHSGTYAQAR